MANINFDKSNSKKASFSDVLPILNISKIAFVTNDNNWVNRLTNAMLTLKIACLDSDKKERKSFSQQISIGSFITPYHRKPILEPNIWLTFEENTNNNNECIQWKTTVELSNLFFKNENECLQITLIDKDHILKRIADWKKRVNNLYKETNSWLKERKDLSFRIGNPTSMYEGLMQSFQVTPTDVNTADILKEEKIIISFKPKGLWIIGANGRIDIISRIGNYILIDTSNQFETPNWKIFRPADNTNGRPFNQAELFNLINLLK